MRVNMQPWQASASAVSDSSSFNKHRNENVEFFRCGLMFLIVLYHCFIRGIFLDSQGWWTIAFDVLWIWHVDAFVAISGWFGVKWSIKKFLHLFSMAFFYTALSFVVGFFWRDEAFAVHHLAVEAGWFGGTYLMLMMVSPLLNLCLDGLCKLPKKEVFRYWGLFALSMFLTWAPFHLFTGVSGEGAGGFSITMFVFVYVTVRIVRLLDLPLTRKHVLFCVAFFIVGVLLMGSFNCVVRLAQDRAIGGQCFKAEYNAPYVWVMAVAMMVWFAKFAHVPKWLGRVCGFCGPSMFGIYLCHNATRFGLSIYRMPETWLSQHTSLHPSVIISLCAVGTFLLCLGVDLARRFLFVIVTKGCQRFKEAICGNC